METELLSIVEASPCGVAVLVGEELRFVFANRFYCSALMEGGQDPTGRRLEEVLHGQELERDAPVLRQVLASGEPAAVEGETRPAAPRARVFCHHVRPFSWSGERAVLVVLSETTQLEEQRARAEQAIHEAWALQRITDPLLGEGGDLEALLQRLVDRIREVMDAHGGTILLLDPAARELVLRKSSGFASEEALGTHLRLGEGLAGRVALEGVTLYQADARTDPAAWAGYVRARQIRGILASPMRVAGRVVGVVHVDFQVAHEFGATEIHLLELMAARAAIAVHRGQLHLENQRQRDRLSTVIDTAPIGIIAYDADGRLKMANRAAEVIAGRPADFGVRIQDEIAHYAIHLTTGELIPLEEYPAARALQGRSCARLDLVIHRPQGNQVILEANAAPVRDAAGEVVGAVMTLEDVSTLRGQEYLRQEFLAAATHELKTPLTVIKGCAKLLAVHGGARDRRLVESLGRACARIDRRIDEMLEAVQLKRMPRSSSMPPVDLGQLAGEAVEAARREQPSCAFGVWSAPAVLIHADPPMVREAITYLIDNALQRSTPGAAIEVKSWCEGKEACLSVADRGPPIPPDRQVHAFEPFFIPLAPGSPGYRSTVGLGLHLVKLIADGCGGRVWLESQPGSGSTVHLCFPAAAAKEAAGRPCAGY